MPRPVAVFPFCRLQTFARMYSLSACLIEPSCVDSELPLSWLQQPSAPLGPVDNARMHRIQYGGIDLTAPKSSHLCRMLSLINCSSEQTGQLLKTSYYQDAL